MSRPLFEKGLEVISSRAVWEQKQRAFYMMRHDGLRRRGKPFPTAADLHFPLVDMNIRKMKPFWISQALASDRIAQFTALREQLADTTAAAADFFNFEVRQRTNYARKLRSAVDAMLLRGRGVLKVTVDPFDDYRIVFEAVDPMFILMPDSAVDFEDADWFVHVRHMTVAQYERDRRYVQDPFVINQIKGSRDRDFSQYFMDKQAREGITHTRQGDEIILWEHYTKTMGGAAVTTYCPQAPEVQVRKPFGVPYKVGGKVSVPFFSFTMEIKDEGWYSPRGIAELDAAFEAYMCKLWNEKADAMTFGNRPVFTSENEIPNTANIRWNPGEFIPGNVKPVVMPQPAMSFDQELMFVRAVSEQVVSMPDFGIVDANQVTGKARTATENNRIAQLQSVSSDDNGVLFREDLGRMYRHVWGLMLQFRRKDVTYFVADQLRKLPDQAVHDQYLVEPEGTPDQWNRQLRFARSMARLQMFRGVPNVDQDVLVRDALNADDPRLAAKALIPSSQKAASEAEDEAMEIGILKEGFPAVVMPGEDHATRIHVLVGWLQKQAATGAAMDPIAKQRVQEHLATHFMVLKQQQPEAARALQQQVLAAEGGGAPAAGPGAEAGPTGAPAPGEAPPGPGPGPGPGVGGNGAPGSNGAAKPGVRESVAINYKDAPEDIKRQMEAAAGFEPSRMGAAPTLPGGLD